MPHPQDEKALKHARESPRKPRFKRQNVRHLIRLRVSWRKPKGIDSKMRIHKSGFPKPVDIGYGSPRATKGLHPSGCEELTVHRPEDLEAADPSRHIIRIAHTVGRKKRIKILEKAGMLGVKVANPRGVKTVESEEPEEIGG